MKLNTKRLSILFIDDLEKCKQNIPIESLEKKYKCDILYQTLHDKTVSEFVAVIKDLDEPDIILMDHKLTEMSDQNVTGSSLSELIKDKWPTIPIVGVTNIDIENKISASKKNIYDEIILKDELIKDKFLVIDSIARSYLTLKTSYSKPRNKTSDDIIKNNICSWVGASEDDLERIFKIIPPEIIKSYKQPDFISLLSRWIRKEFIHYPGFVYDSMWSSTILGIKEDSFMEIKDKFKDAKYTGPFFLEKDLWWKTKLLKCVYKLANDNIEAIPFLIKKKFKEIKDKDFAICENCGELFPEIVGYVDDSMSKKVPLHLKCSLLTNKIPSKLFYEDVRIMEGE